MRSHDVSAAASQVNSREEEINVSKKLFIPVIFTPGSLVLLVTIHDFAHAKQLSGVLNSGGPVDYELQ